MNTTSLHVSERLGSMARHTGGAMALRGLLAVLLGVIALRRPAVAAAAIVVVFALYAIADGILDFVLAARFGRMGERWGWYLFEGIVSVALGVVALAYPGLTLVALALLVGLRAVMIGIFDLAATFSWREIESRWLLGLTGVLSLVLGFMLLASPVAGGAALIWTIGIYGLVFGVALFALGLRMLSAARHETMPPHKPAAAT
jgi:uncharacterized membrane protein HdeD (DUF308 family)